MTVVSSNRVYLMYYSLFWQTSCPRCIELHGPNVQLRPSALGQDSCYQPHNARLELFLALKRSVTGDHQVEVTLG